MIALLDTSTGLCRLRLIDETTTNFEWQADRTLARDLLGYLRDRLAERGASFHDLTSLAVYRGPGSFTGLRIGITVMNTLADSLNIPIVGETGDEWQTVAVTRLRASENDRIVLPEYGSDAHITTPRK